MKRILYVILGLTFFDAMLTAYGLSKGIIEETNPLLVSSMNSNPVLAGATVCIAVAFLLLVIYKYHEKIKWLKWAVRGILAVKIAIAGLHLNWICNAVKMGELF